MIGKKTIRSGLYNVPYGPSMMENLETHREPTRNMPGTCHGGFPDSPSLMAHTVHTKAQNMSFSSLSPLYHKILTIYTYFNHIVIL